MSEAKTVNPMLNTVLWVVCIALLAGGIYGNIYFGSESLLYRVLGLIVVAMIAALVGLQTVEGRSFWELLKGARIEIRKVVWPTRQESTQTAMLVLVVVVLTGMLLWGLDTLLGWLASLAIG